MKMFRTKEEKKLMDEFEREEQMDQFNEKIAELKNKKQEFAKIAAMAELNGDENSYNIAVNGLLEIEENISAITSIKTQFDIINVSNSIAVMMTQTMNILNNMSSNKFQLPNIRKIQKTQLKLKSYMRNISVSNKAISNAITKSNPSNKVRSPEEIKSVRPLIESELIKLSPTIDNSVNAELAKAIEDEKNNIV